MILAAFSCQRQSQGKSAGGDERISAAQAKVDAIREEQERVTAEAKYEKEAAEEVKQENTRNVCKCHRYNNNEDAMVCVTISWVRGECIRR